VFKKKPGITDSSLSFILNLPILSKSKPAQENFNRILRIRIYIFTFLYTFATENA